MPLRPEGPPQYLIIRGYLNLEFEIGTKTNPICYPVGIALQQEVTMSDLVVVAFDDENTAFRVRDKLVNLQKEHLIELEDLVAVVHQQDGKVNIKQAHDLVSGGALSGSFWGLLIGLIFFMPLLGLAIGAVMGALAGRMADYGIDDTFIKDVAEQVKPGNSAVFVLIRKVTPDKVLAQMGEFKGQVIKTSLTAENEAKVREAFGEKPMPAVAEAGPAVSST
jgi:uncharacterized membrane protein